METTVLLFRLFQMLVGCFLLMGAALGDIVDTGAGNSECSCLYSFDDIKAKTEEPTAFGELLEIPVCSTGETIDFPEAIDVTDKMFRLFTSNCDAIEDSSIVSAVFSGETFFSTNTTSNHEISISNVKFQKDGGNGNRPSIESVGHGILEVLGCTFEGMRGNNGKAIDNDGKINKDRRRGTVSVRGCSFHGHNANNGGAISNRVDGDMLIEDSTFSNNQAQLKGGAIYNGDAGRVTIKNATFSSNQATSDGGAICNTALNGAMAIESSTFSSNEAKEHGGAIYNNEGPEVTIKNSMFSGNQAEDKDGGAIYNSDGGMTINDSTFSGNWANYGGAVHTRGMHHAVTIQGTTFLENIASLGGGAIRAYDGLWVQIRKSTFQANVAVLNGGAIGMYASGGMSVFVSENEFIENKDTQQAGAVYLQQKVECQMEGNHFTNNTSGESGNEKTIHVAFDDQSKLLCPQEGNTFIPSQDEFDLPTKCVIDSTDDPSPLCNSIIEEDATLSEDVLCNCDENSSPLITLQSKGITLDMNGHTVKCTDSSTTKAEACISVLYTLATVTNGTVANCDVGIKLGSKGRGSHEVSDVSISSSTVGMVVPSDNSWVHRNTIVASEGGIQIGGNGALIGSNTVSVAEGHGIELLEDAEAINILRNNVEYGPNHQCVFVPEGLSDITERRNMCNMHE